jgi:hypothetical protein
MIVSLEEDINKIKFYIEHRDKFIPIQDMANYYGVDYNILFEYIVEGRELYLNCKDNVNYN